MRLIGSAVLSSVLAGCAMHGPVVADVRCPKGTHAITAGDDGKCVLPDGKRHGPSWSASERGVTVDGYDHDVLAGPYEHYDAHGKLVARGYRPGVTDSTEQATEVSESRWDSPATTGKLVWPARVRLFPVQADVAFAASTLVSSEGKPTSSFVGGTIDVGIPPRENLRFRGDAYRAFFIAYGVQGLAGAITRAECDDPTIAGSGGFCGSRWMLGPYIRVGYVRSHDAHASASLPSTLLYGKIAFLIGRDQWSSTYSSGDSLVWRVRGGAGYTALGSLLGVAGHAASSPNESWRWLLVPLAFLFEHAEAYAELGGDGTSSLGVGAGVDLGFGL